MHQSRDLHVKTDGWTHWNEDDATQFRSFLVPSIHIRNYYQLRHPIVQNNNPSNKYQTLAVIFVSYLQLLDNIYTDRTHIFRPSYSYQIVFVHVFIPSQTRAKP